MSPVMHVLYFDMPEQLISVVQIVTKGTIYGYTVFVC